MWTLLLIAAVILLLTHFNGPNAVWGGATIGSAVAVAIALVGEGFDWSIVLKGLTIGTFVGTVFQWLPELVKPTAKDSRD